MMTRVVLSCVAIALLLHTGCSNVPDGPRTVPAEGVVTLDGDPVEGAAVVFVSADGGQYAAQGASDKDGKFSLNAVEYKTGAVPGEYMAVITKNKEVTSKPKGKANAEELQHAAEEGSEGGGEQLGVVNVMPEKYQQPNPKFTFTIPEDGITDLKIELTSK